MTAKLNFKKYRKWNIELSFQSLPFPIVYKDGFIGGEFRSYVEISSGDLHGNTGKRPTTEVYAVEAVMHYKKGKDRTFARVYSSMAHAMLVYQRIRREIEANTPISPVTPWS